MGVMEANKKCVTCGQTEKKCIGHFGHIVLNIDVLHPLFNKLTMLILKCICYKCSRVLLSKEQLELNNLLKYQKQTRFNKIVEKMDKIDYCTHCETIQPRYLFCTQDKHFYMIFKMDGENMRMQMFESEIRKIFENVICDDIILLGFDPANFHPKNLVLNVLPVIPPVARPFIIADNMTCDDDLTIQYQEIVKANFILVIQIQTIVSEQNLLTRSNSASRVCLITREIVSESVMVDHSKVSKNDLQVKKV